MWAVRDRYSGSTFALKALSEDASNAEMAALVREAVSLSGLEGLDVPRVQRFGRLPQSGRPFMVREMVDGESLLDLMEDGHKLDAVLAALARAAAQLTLVHRAGLFHGDVKPANIIVAPDGKATLVDLGLSAPWKEGGTTPEGLTPKYAAPELFEGRPLTVRAEVFALGATLEEALEKAGSRSAEHPAASELQKLAARATADDPGQRHPSADEFAVALRRAAGVRSSAFDVDAAAHWPIVGIDATAGRLLDVVNALRPGDVLRMDGPAGSGRSVLMRRLAWSLGIEGRPIVWIDGAVAGELDAIAAELSAHEALRGIALLVDDGDDFEGSGATLIREAREHGARLIVVGDGRFGETHTFAIPPLEEHSASELVRRAVPSLTAHLVCRALELSGGRPGVLRSLVRRIAARPMASTADLEAAIGESDHGVGADACDPLQRARELIDRGRYRDARSILDAVLDQGLVAQIERARLDLGLGDVRGALSRLQSVEQEALAARDDPARVEEAKRWRVYYGRAHLSVADYERATELLAEVVDEPSWLGAEALAYKGLLLMYLGRHDEARQVLQQAVERARGVGAARPEAVALLSLGVVEQRDDHADDAIAAYERALVAAEQASEAGLLATVQLNLAGVLKVRGDLARAVELFGAAVDMGRRSGRLSTVRNALLNLANTDLYLGRLARARESIEALDEEGEQLVPFMRAQHLGLEAELAARSGETDRALELYQSCAEAYRDIGRGIDSAEARLEGVLVGSRARSPDLGALRVQLAQAEADLGEASAHRPLLLLARARVAWLTQDEVAARSHLDAALEAAREAGQREWVWRALESRGDIAEAAGQSISARRDREDALAVLEEIGARLPRDLREVYWNDERRRALRDSVKTQLGQASTQHYPGTSSPPDSPSTDAQLSSSSQSITEMGRTPLEQRLARLLEINADLAGEIDVERLTARITDYAVELVNAERGFVLLLGEDGSLSIYTSRSRQGGEPHAEFSRSIARSVLAKGEPVVSLSARDDARLAGYASVHDMMLRSVACVPITSPRGAAVGALYLETRHRPGTTFERELPTLRAFADQVAIAIENARLLGENRRRAEELSRANKELREAQGRLKELLGDRTEKLKRARKRLRAAHDTLYGHFGYHGLVGTSQAMRRVYALIDRIKDTDVPVLITGESGTGKEVVARAIHAASARSKRKFIGVNCGAIPDNLLESELFGHVRGAFTGADRERKGLLRESQGGTALLDEIGEMPTKMQSGMLRVLQEHRVRPVGGTEEEEVDLRLIFATNRDLEGMVKTGSFREDLYYRIHVVGVAIPPLRERPEDIPQLVDHFLGRFAARYKRERKTVDRDALRRLMAYDWPGNVRQLENVLLNAWVLSDQPDLDASDFSLPGGLPPPTNIPLPDDRYDDEEFDVEVPSPVTVPPVAPGPPTTPAKRKRRAVSEHRAGERERILQALQACNWNRVKAAEMIGIPRRTFYRRLREYGLQ